MKQQITVGHQSGAHNGQQRTGSSSAFKTIFYGGLIVGVLDALDAVFFSGLVNAASPVRVFQYVASGLLGRAAFGGGAATAVLGLALHFLIAFLVTTVYYVAGVRFPALHRRALLWGLTYGVVVYFVMNLLVVPLSAAPGLAFSPASLLNGVIGHALLVGLPIALVARHFAKTN